MTIDKEKVLVLKTCNSNLQSHGGFQYPEAGLVESPDWKDTQRCGNGLHGLLWGEGAGALLSWDNSAKWLVLEVDASTIVELGGKVKFPRGVVVHVGDQVSATKYIAEHGGAGKAIVGATVTAGDHGIAIVGDRGRANAGDFGRANAGDYGRACVGVHGRATAGGHGTATAGDRARAAAGTAGCACAGDRGRVSAGDYSTICLWEHDGERRRLRVAYVGEGGIKPNVPYRLDDSGAFVEAG
jgi:hypothetical protein